MSGRGYPNSSRGQRGHGPPQRGGGRGGPRGAPRGELRGGHRGGSRGGPRGAPRGEPRGRGRGAPSDYGDRENRKRLLSDGHGDGPAVSRFKCFSSTVTILWFV